MSGKGPQLTVDVTLRTDAPVPPEITSPKLVSLVEHALSAEGAVGDWEINLLFTSDEVIQDMHREYMGLDTPTDIMTFPFDAGDEFPPGALVTQGGDIVISVATAQEHAREAGWSLAHELAFLVLHGVLHLNGWDDGTDAERESMLARQSALMAAWLEISTVGEGTAAG